MSTELLNLIKEHRSELKARMIEDYNYFIDTDGRVSYKIYIWENGEFEELQIPSGSNERLVSSTRKLYFICNVGGREFDWKDCAEEHNRDWWDNASEEEVEQLREETLDWLKSEYDADEQIDSVLEEIAENECDG